MASSSTAAAEEDGSCHHHLATDYFAQGFAVLSELRQEGTLTDVTLTACDANVQAHKLVLMAASDYFRTMFKACYTEANSDHLSLPGVDPSLLAILVDYFYTGCITVTEDNVLGLLEASSLLLLPDLVQACGQFLSDHLDVSNCLRIRAIATAWDYGGLDWLAMAASRFVQLNFEQVWRSPEFIGHLDDGSCDDASSFTTEPMLPLLNAKQLANLLRADDLCVDSEESVFYCVERWAKGNKCSRDEVCDASGGGNSWCSDSDGVTNSITPALPQEEVLTEDEKHMILLWDTVRFPLLPDTFRHNVVLSSPFMSTIVKTDSYQMAKSVAGAQSSTQPNWNRSVRRRGLNMDLVVAHCDGSDILEVFNTDHEDVWQALCKLPSNCPRDAVAIAGHRSKVYLVGGTSGCTCHIYDLATSEWTVGPSMQEPRWHHGLVRLGDMLYAVGGCGQQNSMEAICLSDLESGWAARPPMNVRRYLPGVATLAGAIYVVGGADNEWSAQSTVECFDPGAHEWLRLANMNCPRAQPAVCALNGLLYVMGGRNSKKVELKSVECYNPSTNMWTLLDDNISGSLRKKRWASAAVAFRDENLMVIGGRGRWAGGSVEVFCQQTSQWTLTKNPVMEVDKRYTATIATRPCYKWSL